MGYTQKGFLPVRRFQHKLHPPLFDSSTALLFVQCFINHSEQTTVIIGPQRAIRVGMSSPSRVPARAIVEHLCHEPIVEIVSSELEGMKPARFSEVRAQAALLVQSNAVVFGDSDMPTLAVLLEHGRKRWQSSRFSREAEALLDVSLVHTDWEESHPPHAIPSDIDLKRWEEGGEASPICEGG